MTVFGDICRLTKRQKGYVLTSFSFKSSCIWDSREYSASGRDA
jgi:hypothetical protein